MAARVHSRVYLRVQDQPRAFWWFLWAADQSVYFGSSNAKHFRVGTTGQSRTSATAGVPLNPELGRAMTMAELAGKISIHGSGIVNLATMANGRRDRHVVKAPREGFDWMPLILVLPMRPNLYPVCKKAITNSDIVIPADDERPFALLFYLKKAKNDPPIIQMLQKRFPNSLSFHASLGDVQLSVWKYRPSGYNVWMEREGEVIAAGTDPNSHPSWPLID